MLLQKEMSRLMAVASDSESSETDEEKLRELKNNAIHALTSYVVYMSTKKKE